MTMEQIRSGRRAMGPLQGFAAVVALAVLLIGRSAVAIPISIGGTTFALGLDAFPNMVTQIGGVVVGPVFGGVTGAEGLTGADIDVGAFNIEITQVFELSFAVPVVNQPGDDIFFTDARFDDNALSFSLDGGATFFVIAAGDFVDTGVDSAIRGGGSAYDLFAATIDMSDFGFAPGASISSLRIRGAGGLTMTSDPIVVGNLNDSVSSVPMPAPASLSLFALGLAGLASLFVVRRGRMTRRSAMGPLSKRVEL